MKAIILYSQEWTLHTQIIDKTVLEYMTEALKDTKANEILTLDKKNSLSEILKSEKEAVIFTAPMPLITKSTVDNIINSHRKSGEACTYVCGVYVLNCEDLSLSLLSECNEHTYSQAEFLKVTDGLSLSKAVEVMKQKINLSHLQNGVIIIDPSQTYIGLSVVIGKGTVIYPQTYLEGQTVIGENCIIGPSTKIYKSVVSDGVLAEYSVILESEVGSETTVGPFAYMRPKSKVGKHCKVGDFVEIKNSVIGDYTKASHLTYVGDSDVGSHVNFGCGTVTVNYDGANKFRTVIEDNVFIGCNTNLVAPVTVKENSYTAAGSTITEDVPPNSLAIARERQVNKTTWQRKVKKH